MIFRPLSSPTPVPAFWLSGLSSHASSSSTVMLTCSWNLAMVSSFDNVISSSKALVLEERVEDSRHFVSPQTKALYKGVPQNAAVRFLTPALTPSELVNPNMNSSVQIHLAPSGNPCHARMSASASIHTMCLICSARCHRVHWVVWSAPLPYRNSSPDSFKFISSSIPLSFYASGLLDEHSVGLLDRPTLRYYIDKSTTSIVLLFRLVTNSSLLRSLNTLCCNQSSHYLLPA